jgi:hypothetical protein
VREIIDSVASVEVKLLARIAILTVKPHTVIPFALAELLSVTQKIVCDPSRPISGIDSDRPEIRSVPSVNNRVPDDVGREIREFISPSNKDFRDAQHRSEVLVWRTL